MNKIKAIKLFKALIIIAALLIMFYSDEATIIMLWIFVMFDALENLTRKHE